LVIFNAEGTSRQGERQMLALRKGGGMRKRRTPRKPSKSSKRHVGK